MLKAYIQAETLGFGANGSKGLMILKNEEKYGRSERDVLVIQANESDTAPCRSVWEEQVS